MDDHAGFVSSDQIDDEESPILPRRRREESGEMEITPMIDIIFLLLIFFTVSFTLESSAGLDLPPARYGAGVGSQTALVLTVADAGNGRAEVYLADGRQSDARLNGGLEEQSQRIRQWVLNGRNEGRTDVIIKAERGVRHREVARVAAAAGEVENVRLHLAVEEID